MKPPCSSYLRASSIKSTSSLSGSLGGAIERQKNVHIEQLMASHEKAFAEIKNYYNAITHNNLDLIKSLKEEVADVRRREIQDEKAMETVRSPRFEVLRRLHFVDVTRI